MDIENQIFIDEVNLLFKKISIHEQMNPELLSNIKLIMDDMLIINSFAAEYDYCQVKANGYRSWINIYKKFFYLLLDNLNKDGSSNNELIIFSKLLVYTTKILLKVRESSLTQLQMNGTLELEANDLDLATEVMYSYQTLDSSIAGAAYGKYITFWLPPALRVLNRLIYTFIPFSRFFNSVKKIIESGSTANLAIDIHRDMRIDDYLENRSLLNGNLRCRAFATLMNGFFYPRRKEILVPCQQQWIICPETFELKHLKYDLSPERSIRCVILSSEAPTGTIILAFHGGGYMLANANSNEFYYRDWVNNIPGSFLISVDYRLAPENKLPDQLQDGLDVYLWLLSGHESVKEMLGFEPKDVILKGDSAGSHLASSLLIVINEVKKKSKDLMVDENSNVQTNDIIRMPIALFSLFPTFDMKPLPSPSLLLIFLDGLLTAPILFSSYKAAYPLKRNEPTDDSPVSIWRYLFNKVTSTYKYKSWYKGSKEELKKDMTEICDVASFRLMNLADYDDLNGIKSVNLHIFAAEYDPILDKSITIAKRWKGLVTLNVFNNLSHAWIVFKTTTNEASVGNQTIIQKLKEYF